MSWLRGLIAPGIRNPVYANLMMVCILAGGVIAARTLVRETYPECSLDRISIEVAYPGAGPQEVEQGVCTKIEQALQGLVGIKKVTSRSSENGALVIVELLEGAPSAQQVMLYIKDRVDQIDTFPPEVERPIVSELLARQRVINLAIYGEVSERTIKELAVEIKDELLATEAISQIELQGVRDYEISIQVSQETLLQYGLSLEQVAAIVAKNCMDVPAGTLRTSDEEITIRTTGQRYIAREFEDLVLIAQSDGTLIKLGQVATITDGFEEDYKSGRFQGKRAAMLEIFKTAKQDTSTIASTVRDYVEHKRAELPDRLHIDVWADSSREVDARIAMLLENGVLGIALVIVILSLFLDFRVSLYVVLGIPISFAGTLIVMHFTGQTLNMITLFGLIMVTGIIVDDAVVIADSFRERVQSGDEQNLAAINGPHSVAAPVLASSATTIIAFIPLMFVVGIMGKFIEVLPIVVISAIVFSAIEAFCILPSHLQHCLRKHKHQGWFTLGRLAIRRRVEGWIDALLANVYRPTVRLALRARGLTLSTAVACLLLATGLVAGRRTPFTLLPEIDGDILRARVQFPQGVPVTLWQAAVRQLESAADRLNHDEALRQKKEDNLIVKKFSVVGQWSGWIREHGSHLCEVLIELMPAENRKLDGKIILAAWSEHTGVIDDAISVTFSRVQQGPTEKPLEIRLLGHDLDEMRAAADEVVEKLHEFAGVSGIGHDLLPGKREVCIRLKPLARTLGVTLDGLSRQLRSGFYGGEAVRVQRGRDEVRVQVRYPDKQRKSIGNIENVRIRGLGGREIPFRELAEYQIKRGFSSIRHQNGQRRVRITADVDERLANPEQILAEFESEFLTALPVKYPGINYKLEGQHAQMVESLRSLFSGFLIALVGIYAIIAAILSSYYQPIIIMVTIPLGFVGAVAGHALTGYDLTIMSVFGMVALSGVVVNDSLVLLDQINKNVRKGLAIFDAVLEAGVIRFRAVVLTTITTIAGLGPLLFERSTQAQSLIPMAISLTFGLAFATVLTLVVVPVLYLVMIDLHRLARWLRRGGEFPSPESVGKIHA